MAESGFLVNIFKLSLQFCVATTAGTAVMLYDVYSEGSLSKFGSGFKSTDRGFSCFR